MRKPIKFRPPKRETPGVQVNNFVERHGLEWLTRLAAVITLHHQTIRSISINSGVSENVLSDFRVKLFDSAKVEGQDVYFMKPEVRRQLDLLEHSRREMFDATRKAEETYRQAAGRTDVQDPLDRMNLTPGNLVALKQIRRKLGAPGWTAFLTFMYDGVTPPDIIADSFPGVLDGPHDVVTWRKVLLYTSSTSSGPNHATSRNIHKGARL